MAEHGTKSPSLGPVADEGLQQHVTVVAVGAVEHLPQLRGQGVLVTVARVSIPAPLAVEPVQVGQAGWKLTAPVPRSLRASANAIRKWGWIVRPWRREVRLADPGRPVHLLG